MIWAGVLVASAACYALKLAVLLRPVLFLSEWYTGSRARPAQHC